MHKTDEIDTFLSAISSDKMLFSLFETCVMWKAYNPGEIGRELTGIDISMKFSLECCICNWSVARFSCCEHDVDFELSITYRIKFLFKCLNHSHRKICLKELEKSSKVLKPLKKASIWAIMFQFTFFTNLPNLMFALTQK